jgi:hypothetical protein
MVTVPDPRVILVSGEFLLRIHESVGRVAEAVKAIENFFDPEGADSGCRRRASAETAGSQRPGGLKKDE